MKVYIWWHGGSSYSVSGVEDTEEFSSLAAAKRELARRESGADPYYPCVEDSSAWVFFSDPRLDDTGGDHYPDLVIKVGPRGGVVTERT